MNTLNIKQEMFCREYLVDLNATQAAIRAGYSKKTARQIAAQNLLKPNITKRLAQMMKERAYKVDLNVEYVLNNIIEISERCMQKSPVMVGYGKDRDQAKEYVDDPEHGKVLANVWEFDSAGALKAQELLGKYLQIFVEKKQVEHTGEVKHKVTKVDLDERIGSVKNRCFAQN